MPYGQKHTYIALLVACTCVIGLPAGAMLAASDDELVAAKDEFNSLWHSAAETTKKRAELEQNLAQFDAKVASARKDLATAAEKRKAVREQIGERKALFDALQGQLTAAAEAKAFYQAVASSQRDDFTEFVQYLAARNIVDAESGPAAASPFLKRMLHGSLGQTIDDQLAREAVLAARQRFFDQVRVLILESDRVDRELHAAAGSMSDEIALLEKEQSSISSVMDERTAFIDDSWRRKQLTQEEIADIAQEIAESDARIAEMQASLRKINDELKEGKVKVLKEQLSELQKTQDDLTAKRDAVALKDQAMALLEDNALRAFQAGIQAKGTDKKLYLKIEDLKLKRGNNADDLHKLEIQNTGSGTDAMRAQIAALQATITYQDALLALMKDGIPQDLAEATITSRRQADEAKPVRADYAKQIAAMNVQIAEAQKAVSLKVEQIDGIAKQYELTDLPPIFLWPVSGPITAGYFDEMYLAVFHVLHRAIDIAVPQATPVRSISDGIVFTVKDGGAKGFSYILIAHRNGYASLYGHVSAMFVSKGDIVSAGQIIGLSGGLPGTHGAGPMTTGAHVHLEVTKDGVHVNPLSVLPSK